MAGDAASTPALSLPQHLNIVALETFFTPIPPLRIPAPHTFSLRQYTRTTSEEVPSRIYDADILITTTLPLRADALSTQACPKLGLIAVMASGTDSIDLAACTERGIRVLNSPNCNVDAVAEHAVALYFATRRSLLPTMRALNAGDWPRQGTLMTRTYVAGCSPKTCHDEIVVIVGFGGVGRKVAELLGRLGMKVLVAARKGGPVPYGRILFEEALKTATVLVLCCPRSPETVGLVSTPEFTLMREDVIVINVARGGIVDEAAMVTALREGQISGAGVDVFGQEPASPETSPLLDREVQGLNLVTTPHTAWVAMDTTRNYQRVLQENIEGYILGRIQEDRVKA
ncbi:Glycerate dehydrogenase [Cytospora mali]|uniref:Glycerate dehydrogenase n=1 Tax=Cytospora mali TaxID=578113 RepID=A0A194VEH4_CYTMA|nr:Glycerate dehydrogenase [Valsa mali var. pyri (nom. inval.)]